jgi:hypothetical protein
MVSAFTQRGLDQLSPPEVEGYFRELPTNRGEYAGLVADLAGWPDRSPLSRRVPSRDEIAALSRRTARWRAVCLLEDADALALATKVFELVYVLDPLYDSGDLLYGAWHDPAIKVAQASRLGQHAALLVQLTPGIADGKIVLAPEHLPGSWDPRPRWRRDEVAWPLRQALVLLYWVDRLNALVVASARASLALALGPATSTASVGEPADGVRPRVRRTSAGLTRLACELQPISGVSTPEQQGEWELMLGEGVQEPAFLLRRVLNGEDPFRAPSLKRVKLHRRPVCLTKRDGAA